MESTVHIEPAVGNGFREVLIPSGKGRIALSLWEAKGDRPKGVVVFLAGTMTHPLFYSRFLSALAEGGYTVAGVHTAGHGRSPRTLKRYSFSDMEENCRDAINYVRSTYGGPIILMGSSQGGALASSVAASLPEGEIAALFAHNILMPELPSSLSVTRYPMWLSPFYRLIPVLMRFFARIVPDLRLPIGFYLNPDRIFSDPGVRKAFYNDPEGLISYPLCFLSSLFSADMSALSDGSLKVPVTMIAVTGDPLFSFDYQKEVFGRLKAPGKRLLTIEEDVHLILNERVERVTPVILEALDTIG
jgi:alpha-beta hydrolase superfamily lysophospholipase